MLDDYCVVKSGHEIFEKGIKAILPLNSQTSPPTTSTKIPEFEGSLTLTLRRLFNQVHVLILLFKVPQNSNPQKRPCSKFPSHHITLSNSQKTNPTLSDPQIPPPTPFPPNPPSQEDYPRIDSTSPPIQKIHLVFSNHHHYRPPTPPPPPQNATSPTRKSKAAFFWGRFSHHSCFITTTLPSQSQS